MGKQFQYLLLMKDVQNCQEKFLWFFFFHLPKMLQKSMPEIILIAVIGNV